MPTRARVTWEKGKTYRGKNGGKRLVLDTEGGRVKYVVVDPAGDMTATAGDEKWCDHLYMKRWTRNEDKTLTLASGGE